MKLTKTAGKTSLSITRTEWEKIGTQNGWTKAADSHPAEVDALIWAASELGHRLDPDSLTQLWKQDPKLFSEMYAAFNKMADQQAATRRGDEQARKEELHEEGYAPPSKA
jgi:hypothetical protein